jgi:hypothetical protein
MSTAAANATPAEKAAIVGLRVLVSVGGACCMGDEVGRQRSRVYLRVKL